MASTNWNPRQLPTQQGKVFLVTGATGGIGYFVVEQLLGAGAEVIVTARDPRKAQLTLRALSAQVPDGRVRTLMLDLADPASIDSAAMGLADEPLLDGVVFNAGVLAQKARRETVAGHELVYGTNHLGHFAFGAPIYPLLARGQESRIVTTGSVAARRATLDLDDLESTRPPYKGFATYKRSKLAQMIFAFELQRRLRASGSDVASIVAHPGGALDGLTPDRVPLFSRGLGARLRAVALSPLVQGKDRAAWPAVRALLDPEAEQHLRVSSISWRLSGRYIRAVIGRGFGRSSANRSRSP